MNTADPDKDSHLIEAIVFTTDFLSCTKKPLKCSIWTCGNSSSVETIEADEFSSSDNDGPFGFKRRQLISYKNTDDLTRKVDALFHRKRSTLSAGAAAEIRDNLVEKEDRDHEPEDNDHHFFSNLQRRIDDATSTCPSTNPSLSQDELNHWYSSSWSSFTYYGSANKGSMSTTAMQASNSQSKRDRPHRSILKHSIQKDPHSRQWVDGKTSDGQNLSNTRSSSMPDFLTGVEFKNTCHHHRVISLPPSLPSKSPFCSSAHREVVSPVETCVQNQSQGRTKTKIVDSRGLASKKKNKQGGSQYRRLGRKTRECWDKARRLFRRQEEKLIAW
eukprot:CAMPEP_0116102290 /NCGR_PEP_ID=MMETSP0327-20121206/13267_1 /TAXON_ID=44447 /ORGANISM="Pseudo-nitzschia delicatissima, Strain B596" /LENGTH=329 /DNA_ID=CAMNT_0003594313 /DNA_START=133 /DNA_END=1122 /DNA_ORIENTATION=+